MSRRRRTTFAAADAPRARSSAPPELPYPGDPRKTAYGVRHEDALWRIGQAYFGRHCCEVLALSGAGWKLLVLHDPEALTERTTLRQIRFVGDAEAFRAWHARIRQRPGYAEAEAWARAATAETASGDVDGVAVEIQDPSSTSGKLTAPARSRSTR